MQEIMSLSTEMVGAIVDFIKDKEEEKEVPVRFPNVLIRDDVLELLNEECTVIFYPLEDEVNNGFHVDDIHGKDGKYWQFVFINTAQTTDRQAFTAAHELGHVWGVDKAVAERCRVDFNEDLSEEIINRFAAELLMPGKQFCDAFNSEYEERRQDDDSITVLNLLKIIVILMNRFMAPYKAVVRRLLEVGAVPQSVVNFLIDGYEEPEGIIRAKVDEIIEGYKFTKLQIQSKRKWIKDLPELLDFVEENQLVLPSKIIHMRDVFQIEQPTENAQMERVLNVHKEQDKGF